MEKIAMVWEGKRLRMVRRGVGEDLDRLRVKYEGKRQQRWQEGLAV